MKIVELLPLKVYLCSALMQWSVLPPEQADQSSCVIVHMVPFSGRQLLSW